MINYIVLWSTLFTPHLISLHRWLIRDEDAWKDIFCFYTISVSQLYIVKCICMYSGLFIKHSDGKYYSIFKYSLAGTDGESYANSASYYDFRIKRQLSKESNISALGWSVHPFQLFPFACVSVSPRHLWSAVSLPTYCKETLDRLRWEWGLFHPTREWETKESRCSYTWIWPKK